MKQRIRLSILMLWSFMHLLLFAFNGFNFQNRLDSSGYNWFSKSSYHTYSSAFLFPPYFTYDFRGWINEIKYVGLFDSNFLANFHFHNVDFKYYDITEFLVYVISPVFFICLYNYIKYNQFRLLVK